MEEETRPVKRSKHGVAGMVKGMTPADQFKLTKQALDTFIASGVVEVDLHNPESVENAIINYFHQCQTNGLQPGNMGIYAALGISRQDYNDSCRGKNKSKIGRDSLEVIKRATRAMSAYREGLMLEGKINPVAYIFMGKNFDGLEDQTHIEVTAKPGYESSLSPEEIARQIEKDIPIDADYKEADGR